MSTPVTTTLTTVEYLATFAIGCAGSGMALFGSYVGLKNYEELPAKLLNKSMATIYIVLGGFLAFIFQLVAPTSFTPLYSLTVGVGWPALLIGLSTSQSAQNIANAKLKEIEDLIKGIQGG